MLGIRSAVHGGGIAMEQIDRRYPRSRSWDSTVTAVSFGDFPLKNSGLAVQKCLAQTPNYDLYYKYF
ncbi:hypothetical protein [Fontibacillus panacisegetis]|uniref:hypothetical protein n=1 Tax=Fontibacillus panacisegetis TaxID=670482 RepID=UPI000B8683C9|nr:hypothetical protein [Fontibacillus panacisegetis]